MTFGEETEGTVADMEAARQHGWRIAREDAYPSAIRKERGMSYRPPLAWELEVLEACLLAAPLLVQRRRQDDGTPEEVAVTTSEELKLRLSWVTEDELIG